MHQIANTGKSHLKYVQKLPKNNLRRWLREPGRLGGVEWLSASGFGIDGTADVPDWTAKPWPAANAVNRAGGPNRQVGHHTMKQTTLTSSYNGHAGDLSHPFVPTTKKRAEDAAYKGIKASHWLDHTMSGLLDAFMYAAGVDDKLAAAVLGLHACLRPCFARVISVRAVESAKERYQTALRDFHQKALPSEYKASLHALSHLFDQVLRYGPLQDLWSFPFEGLFAILKPMAILNKAMPAQTLVARFQAIMHLRHVIRCMGWGEGNRETVSPRHVQATYCGNDRGRVMQGIDDIDVPDHVSPLSLINKYYSTIDSTIATALEEDVSHVTWDMAEFDTLKCAGVRIQGARTQATATDDRHVFLRGSGDDPPALGHVQSIFRFQCSADGNQLEAGAGRLLLLVRREPLQTIDESDRLGSCGFAESKNPGFAFLHIPPLDDGEEDYRIVGIDDVLDQCFLVPDLLTGGQRSLVLSTWPLQNIVLVDPFQSEAMEAMSDM